MRFHWSDQVYHCFNSSQLVLALACLEALSVACLIKFSRYSRHPEGWNGTLCSRQCSFCLLRLLLLQGHTASAMLRFARGLHSDPLILLSLDRGNHSCWGCHRGMTQTLHVS